MVSRVVKVTVPFPNFSAASAMHRCWAAVILPLTVMIRPEKLSVPLLDRKPIAFTRFSSAALTVSVAIVVSSCVSSCLK